MGAWGAESSEPLRYPWAQWVDGGLWGFCPAKFKTTPDSFKRTLRMQAQRREKDLVMFNYRLFDQDWVMFSMKTRPEKPEIPFSWLESTD